MARPKKEFNKNSFEELCRIQCTKSEICSVLDIDDETLNRMIKDEYDSSFSDIYKKYSEDGKMSLRRWQRNAAQKGNASLLIWLGKQDLGQRDIVENVNNDRVIIINDLAELNEDLEDNNQ